MVDQSVVDSLARHWEDGWNGVDLDVIMAPFAPGIVFSSPFVAVATGDSSRSTVEGIEELRTYVAQALERSGDVRYTLHGAYAGTDAVILAYTCHLPNGTDKPGADLMRVDGDGRVVEWRCHYASDPTSWRSA